MNMVLEFSRGEKRRLRIWIQRERHAGARSRLLMILHLSKGKAVTAVAEHLHVARSTVYRVMERFHTWGWAGVADRREDNGRSRVDEYFLLQLRGLVAGSPQDYGYARPTWTLELLVAVMVEHTGERISTATMSRCLRSIGARLGRPRPVLHCPWEKRRRNRRLRRLRRLTDHLGRNEIAVYADEVDIHLNPKIGLDWMLKGEQKQVVTPGKNVKRYLAGAREVGSGRLTWVQATHKRSGLFIALLEKLQQVYSTAKTIYVIVDNYSIHSSRQTQWALTGLNRIQLHFLPPYSPEFNPIERVWLDLHAEVTRNHRCAHIEELMQEVEDYLRYRNRRRSNQTQRAVA